MERRRPRWLSGRHLAALAPGRRRISRRDAGVPVTMNDERFTLAYAHYYPQVLRFLRGMLGGRGDAPDLAQEVFLRLHARGPADEESLRFWLFRVARNLALNELRRWRLRDALAPLVSIFASAESPDERLLRDEKHRALLEHIAALPPDQRAALLLREWEEMSYDEIAATLEVSVAKVKSDLFRARQSLRAAMTGGKR